MAGRAGPVMATGTHTRLLGAHDAVCSLLATPIATCTKHPAPLSPPPPTATRKHQPEMVLKGPPHRHSVDHRACQSRLLCPCRLRTVRLVAPRSLAPAGAAAVLPALQAEPDGCASKSALPLFRPAGNRNLPLKPPD